MNKVTLVVFLSAIVLQGCKKENRISKNLEGTWTITELNLRRGLMTDFSTETRTFQFLKYKNAYTRTMKGIYRVDYIDPNKKPIVDTFEYQLKGNVIEITKVQDKKINGMVPNTSGLLKRRFMLSNSASNTFTLTRMDSTGLYIRATKQ